MKHIFKLKKLLLYINVVEKIKVNVPDLYIKIFDIKYEIKIKNQLSDNRIKKINVLFYKCHKQNKSKLPSLN